MPPEVFFWKSYIIPLTLHAIYVYEAWWVLKLVERHPTLSYAVMHAAAIGVFIFFHPLEHIAVIITKIWLNRRASYILLFSVG